MLKKEKMILALDLAMGCSGAAIFDKNGKLLSVTSVSTSGKVPHGMRLMKIGEFFIDLRSQYEIDTVIIERGFSRFANSTQAIFKTMGIANYIFYDCETIYYPPSTVKKVVSGNGRASKEELKEIVEKKYPNIEIKNLDISDAVSVGLCHFIKMDEKDE